jgi:hypothetical protein
MVQTIVVAQGDDVASSAEAMLYFSGGVSAQTLLRCSTSNATTNIWAWDSDGGRRRRQRCRRFAQTRLVVRPGRGLRLPLSAYVQLHKVLLAGWTRRTASQTSGRPSGAVARQT